VVIRVRKRDGQGCFWRKAERPARGWSSRALSLVVVTMALPSCAAGPRRPLPFSFACLDAMGCPVSGPGHALWVVNGGLCPRGCLRCGGVRSGSCPTPACRRAARAVLLNSTKIKRRGMGRDGAEPSRLPVAVRKRDRRYTVRIVRVPSLRSIA
jgi:hypothetical protein